MDHQIIMPHDHGNIDNVLEAMPSKETCNEMAASFKQLCDGTRLQIFWLLCHSEECVLNICAAVNMSAPAVSHHLRCLRDAGLICGHRHGKEVHYTLASTPEARLLHHFVDSILKTNCPADCRCKTDCTQDNKNKTIQKQEVCSHDAAK